MKLVLCFLLLVLIGCGENNLSPSVEQASAQKWDSLPGEPFLVVLGTIQDGGSPHIGCKKECCSALFDQPDPNRRVVSLGLIDPESNTSYLFEATPDLSRQVKDLSQMAGGQKEIPDGVFLTHAHIGHYTGLQYFGKEAMNANGVPVYTMPRMKGFLTTNGPWSQLVSNNNIELRPIQADSSLILTKNLTVTALQVPHRDEYSETVGFLISGPQKSALFIPDIDKWERWERSIVELIELVDVAYVDATFYHGEEIQIRDISQIPHPFIEESMELFGGLSAKNKAKVNFIHFNHTNPVLDMDSEAYQKVLDNGFSIAQIYDVIAL